MSNEELLQAIKGMIQEELQPIKTEISTIKEDVSAIKGQQKENSGYVQALLHRTEELDAKFDGLLHNTVTKDALNNLATKEDIGDTNDHLKALNERLFHQEAALNHLKAVK